ncbi:hypothetical protein QBC40DRAFT_136038, partial [Triangularia verruculosa]
AGIRKNLFRIAPGPNGTPNEPVARLQALRSKLLIPTNVDHDPYIVATLLAMAQAHFYRIPAYSGRMTPNGSQGQKGVRLRMPQFRDIKVQLITHDEGQKSDPHFIVYTAVVTAAFLERFMTPHKTPCSRSVDSEAGLGMKIAYTPVKVWPILGLKERLAKALGPEISGVLPFDNPDFIDLHGPLVEPAPEQLPVFAHLISQRKLKRRRERQPIEEMLNSSFEEEPPSSDDRPVLSSSAKRRRTARSVGTLEVC